MVPQVLRRGVADLDDVIVVGAGPAGNNAALGLASGGYSVKVIESRHNIGEKLCTGIVGQECSRRFPIEDGLVYREASAAAVNAPNTGQVRFEAAAPQACIIDRVAYVASFARRAQDAGATYLLGQRVLNVQPEADGVTVVTNEGSHRSRAVVLAAGFGSPFTRQLGLGAVSDYVSGAQAVVSTKDLSEVEVHLGRHVAPGFFSWLVPTSAGRALAGLLVRRQARAHLDRFIEGQQRLGKIASVIRHSACWAI